MKYVQRPIVVEAWQWVPGTRMPDWAKEAVEVFQDPFEHRLTVVRTQASARPGDYLVVDLDHTKSDLVSVVKKHVFEKCYQPLKET